MGAAPVTFSVSAGFCEILPYTLKEALINSAASSWHIFFALPSSTNPPHSLAMRPVCFLDRTKNLCQSEGLHFISVF